MRGERLYRVLSVTGVVLAASEVWKQWTLTFVLGHGSYQWWYFPFQLCSLPMYLFAALPWVRSARLRGRILTFVMDYSLLGSLMVWLDTSGLYYPLPALTFHSFAWHILLAAAGLLCGLCRESDKSWRGFGAATAVYAAGCAAAAALNRALGRFGEINMFYINPDLPMTQPVFSAIADRAGNPAAIALYMASTAAGAAILHLCWKRLTERGGRTGGGQAPSPIKIKKRRQL